MRRLHEHLGRKRRRRLQPLRCTECGKAYRYVDEEGDVVRDTLGRINYGKQYGPKHSPSRHPRSRCFTCGTLKSILQTRKTSDCI